jgi:hypothetical protein
MHSSTSTFKAILYCILLRYIGFTDGEAPKMSLLLVYKCMCSYKISLVFIKFLCSRACNKVAGCMPSYDAFVVTSVSHVFMSQAPDFISDVLSRDKPEMSY